MPRKVSTPILPAFVRIVREVMPDAVPVRIREPKDIFDLLAPRAQAEEVEGFYIVALDTQSNVRAVQEVTRGILNSSLVHPREVFRAAIMLGAAGIIAIH